MDMENKNTSTAIDMHVEERIRYLWEQTDFTSTLFRSIVGYAIIAADFDGNIIAYNEGARLIYGYSPEETIGKQKIEVFFPRDVVESGRLQVIINELIAFGSYCYEGEKVRKNGEIFPAQILFNITTNIEGKVIGFVEIVEDISERKRAEREIRELNASLMHRKAELEAANKELEAFSYSVSHDLRAPLRSIDGFSQTLLRLYEEKLDDQGKDFLQRVCAASQRMGQLIDDLLSLSRVTRKEMRRTNVDLGRLVESIAHELRTSEPERDVEFVIELEMVVRGDAGLIRIALENLVGNAWKFTSKRPKARIELGCVSGDSKSLQPSHDSICAGETEEGASQIREGDVESPSPIFFIKDDGVGFDMAFVDNLFAPFHRLHGMTEFPGTGIGLAIVQRIIHRHGGRVWAESVVNEGATFYFTFGRSE